MKDGKRLHLVGDAGATLARYTTNKDFLAKPVQFSIAELERVRNEVEALLNASKIPHTITIDLDARKIFVDLPDPKLIRPLLKDIENTRPVQLRASDFIAKPTAIKHGGRSVTAGLEQCTSGFVVRRRNANNTDGSANYTDGITTAGHCTASSVQFQGSSIPLVATLYPGSRRDVKWHATTSHTFEPKVYVGTGDLAIEATASLGVGAPVCMNGYVSGFLCGRVTNVGVSGTDSKTNACSNSVTFARDNGTVMVRGGDSGAPLVTATNSIGTAHGMEHAGTGETSSGSGEFRTGFYVPVADLSLLNVSVKLSPLP